MDTNLMILAYNKALKENDTLALGVLCTRLKNANYELITSVEEYYNANQDILDEAYQEYINSNDWGSGKDKIKLTDEHFWEFVENVMSKGE